MLKIIGISLKIKWVVPTSKSNNSYAVHFLLCSRLDLRLWAMGNDT